MRSTKPKIFETEGLVDNNSKLFGRIDINICPACKAYWVESKRKAQIAEMLIGHLLLSDTPMPRLLEVEIERTGWLRVFSEKCPECYATDSGKYDESTQKVEFAVDSRIVEKSDIITTKIIKSQFKDRKDDHPKGESFNMTV